MQTFSVAIVNPSIISLLTHVSSSAVSSAASITPHSDSLLQNLFAALRYVVDTTRTCFESMGRVISTLTFSTRKGTVACRRCLVPVLFRYRRQNKSHKDQNISCHRMTEFNQNQNFSVLASGSTPTTRALIQDQGCRQKDRITARKVLKSTR